MANDSVASCKFESKKYNSIELSSFAKSQIVDDNYYLCYMEVMNYGEDYEIQTYLDGEHTTYMKLSTTSIWNVFE